jgi:hypothetical protein
MTSGPSLTTTGAPFAPAAIPLTSASVRFAPSAAPAMPTPDDGGPSVPPSGPGIDDGDAGVRATGATDTRVRAAYCSPGSAVPVARSRAARAMR